MPKYRVQITHDCTASAEVVVEAENPLEAEVQAVQREVWENAKWEMNDNYIDEVYCGDPGQCAEEIDEQHLTVIDLAYEPNKKWTYVVAEMYGGNLQDVHVYQDEDQERCEIAAKALARVLLPDTSQDSDKHDDYDSSQCDSEVYVDLVPDVLHADDAYKPRGSVRILSLAG